MIRKLLNKIYRNSAKELEYYTNLHSAWTEIILTGWDALMRKLEAEGRYDERQKILDETYEARLSGSSVLYKMSEIIRRYQKD